jgi:hypothetical protein
MTGTTASVLVVLVCAVTVLAAPALTGSAHASPWTNCGTVQQAPKNGFITRNRVQARGVSCRTARYVGRRFQHGASEYRGMACFFAPMGSGNPYWNWSCSRGTAEHQTGPAHVRGHMTVFRQVHGASVTLTMGDAKRTVHKALKKRFGRAFTRSRYGTPTGKGPKSQFCYRKSVSRFQCFYSFRYGSRYYESLLYVRKEADAIRYQGYVNRYLARCFQNGVDPTCRSKMNPKHYELRG